MEAEKVTARIQEIIAGIRRLRASLYPPGWAADPWLLVQGELEALLEDMKK